MLPTGIVHSRVSARRYAKHPRVCPLQAFNSFCIVYSGYLNPIIPNTMSNITNHGSAAHHTLQVLRYLCRALRRMWETEKTPLRPIKLWTVSTNESRVESTRRYLTNCKHEPDQSVTPLLHSGQIFSCSRSARVDLEGNGTSIAYQSREIVF
ncbi:hypothetical protein BDV59DRAFT_44714 [Aspergillus ambiguus]|uniref:uncharacterized protein n=1 Tax=Aspergillus ambiguus TaxID=176160 RepID=UPI003CCD58C2